MIAKRLITVRRNLYNARKTVYMALMNKEVSQQKSMERKTNKNRGEKEAMRNFFKGKRIISVLLVLTVLFSMSGIMPEKSAEAAAYITREAFVTLVMKELGFTVKADDSYMDAAIRAGIVSKSTFGSKTASSLTKSDAAVVLTNAHEFLYGQTVEDSLLAEIKEKRISDIAKVSKARQIYVVKAYAYGYLKGASNGTYSKNRKFGPSGKITVATAKTLVTMLKDENKRSKIAPDGQLIRTTNLPEFAEFYPYILASFPNDYYDWEFLFMKHTSNGVPRYGTDNWVNLVNYAAPKDFVNFGGEKKIWSIYLGPRRLLTSQQYYDLAAEKWEKNVEKHLELIFNVDYRNIKKDKVWYKQLLDTDIYYGEEESDTIFRLDNYIKKAIENETIVECRKVGVDKSSVYIEAGGQIYIRAYVEYRIVSSKSLERLITSPIIFTQYSYPNFLNVKLGEWRKCYLDVEVGGMYENCGIWQTIINDFYHDDRVVKVP
ncbi:MAG: hypothetical protein E7256_05855 [Lachnospiraceae bacterium]|nr:hypothetical protein [Lachnospiraceae bacterium]